MADLPSGTVTFLFTDIEGSTRLWERDAAAMRRALERHNALLGDAIRAHGGRHFKTVGDAFQAAFSDSRAAVAAAVAAQQALAAEPWPETGPLRVRMALHCGAAEALPNGEYLTPVLHRLSQLLATAHGGQVLLTTAVRTALEELPAGVSVVSLGQHRLADLLQPEEIWQLAIAGLPATFPPLKSLERFPTNLPRQSTPLIGRDGEVAALGEALRGDEARLITLTGPGGVGKTRLALAAAAAALDGFPDGVFLATLAGIEDAALLLPEIAAVLGVREGGGLSLEESVLAYLSGKRLLLVLDNLEQVRPFPDAAAVVARLARDAPALRILATSRAPLRLAAEKEWPVAALPTPRREAGGDTAALETLALNPAVAFFVDRARAARPAWRLTTANATDVAELVRRLEGLPLAIELAAARIRVLSIADILRRLGGALDLLETRTGDRPDRQQNLRAAIAWSHDLLGFEDQVAFRRLAVFAGGFTLEAAEAVFSEAPAPWIDGLNAVSILVEQSLLRAEDDHGEDSRYRMLETVRAFALEHLDAADEGDALRGAQSRWAERFARDGGPHLLGPEGGEWLARYEREHDNFRAAIAWAIAHDPGGLGLRLPDALWRFWDVRGHYAEGRSWLERALAAGHDAPAEVRGQVLQRLGSMAWRQGDLPAATRALAESVEVGRRLQDRKALASALTNLGIVMEMQGELDRALEMQEEAVAIVREMGDPLSLAGALNNLALAVWSAGDNQRAVALLEESVAIRRREGSQIGGLSGALNNLGMLAQEAGDLERAIAYLEEALALDREFGNADRIADLLGTLAGLIAASGDLARAAALDAEALALRRNRDDRLSFAFSFESIAMTASRAGRAQSGARLFGAADQLREELGAPLPPPERAAYEINVALARSALGETAFAQALAAGRALPLETAIVEALHVAQEMAGSDQHESSGAEGRGVLLSEANLQHLGAPPTPLL